MSYPKTSYYQENLQHSHRDPNKTPEKQFLIYPRGGGHGGPTPYDPQYAPGQQQRHQHPQHHGSPRNNRYETHFERTTPGVFIHDPRPRSRATPREHSFPVERHSLMQPGPVKLTPCWEEKNLPNDELNFKNLTLEDSPDGKAPPDRYNMVWFILLLHGVGVLMPWNMFITAEDYFKVYKLNTSSSSEEFSEEYRDHFLSYVEIAANVPNFVFNWLNLFIQLGGDLTTRIVVSILIEVVIFIGTVVLAMIDSSSWPEIFFWTTIASIAVANMTSGVYGNSMFGIAAKLPMKYTNAVLIGNNVSGTLVSCIKILAIAISPNIQTAAIYYFITALFVLLVCFDTYFALPLLRFYRYHYKVSDKQLANKESDRRRIPYWTIFKKCFPQLFNVFLVFFVTLAVFPAVQSDIKMISTDFPIPAKYFTPVVCFLTFNFFALIGNLLSMCIRVPGPRWLWILVLLRVFLIPSFIFCNYLPGKQNRIMPIIIYNDWAYFGLSLANGLTSGYCSSLGMMYCSKSVEGSNSAIAGMMGGVALVSGIVCGSFFSRFIPWLVENVTFYI